PPITVPDGVAVVTNDAGDADVASTRAAEQSVIDRAIGQRLWQESPAATPLVFDELIGDSAPVGEATAEPVAPPKRPTIAATAPTQEFGWPPSTPSEQATSNAAQAAAENRDTSSRVSPLAAAPREMRQRSRPKLEAILSASAEEADLDLLPLGPLDADVENGTPALAELTIDTAGVDRSGRAVLLDEAIDLADDPEELLIASVDEPRLAVMETGEAVTVQRPTEIAYETNEPGIETNDPTIRRRIVEGIKDYNDQIDRISGELESGPPTAFQIADWSNQLLDLAEEKQLATIYIDGLARIERDSLPRFAKVGRLVSRIRELAEQRAATLNSLPKQAVRAELSALAGASDVLSSFDAVSTLDRERD
ncbi:MAG: hypothetical protein AAGG46_04295, partial [Planctomycetota bacterium]